MIENVILSHLISNEEFTRKSLPYLKSEYFHSRNEAIIFNLIESFIKKYNALPTREALYIELSNKDDINEESYKDCQHLIAQLEPEKTDLVWLLNQTEKWTQDKALYNAIRTSISILDDKTGKLSKGSIPKLLSDALSVSFDSSIGHDFLKDYQLRYDFYHSEEKRIPFDLEYFNKITKGGMPRKSLSVILAATGIGKAQPLSTKIPTPFGWKTMGDLEVGDYIFGSDGKFVKILGVYPQGVKQVYELTFADGRKTRCCKEHLWNIFNTKTSKWTTKSVADILEIWKSKFHRKRTYIQLSSPVNYIGGKLPIHPYILGVLIGDGCLSNGNVSLCNNDVELLEQVSSLLPENLKLFKRRNTITYDITQKEFGKNDNVIRIYLKLLGLMGKKSYEKFIPNQYLLGTINERFQLLAGLLDTDGYISRTQAISYTTASLQLAQNVAELVRSLGGIAKISKPLKKQYTDKRTGEKKVGRPAYNVSIRMKRGTNIFHLSRKANRLGNYQYNDLKLRVDDIRLVGKEECQCIKVAAEDMLYLTDDYIVTHNTLAMCHFAASNLIAGFNVLYATLEMAQERIAERIDANLLNVNVDDLVRLSKEEYAKKIERVKSKTTGQLIIKEYPTAGASATNLKYLLNELKLKKNFIPDIIYVDYMNLCVSSRLKQTSDSYYFVKTIAEELRGLAVEYDVPVVTASQFNRQGMKGSDPDLDNTSESIGTTFTADFIFAIISNETMEDLNQVMIKQLKNRYADPSVNRRFIVGVDKAKMRLYNVEENAQGDVVSENENDTFGQVDKDMFKGFH